MRTRFGADLSILRNNRNIGFAAGNNLGWRASKGDRILFLNPDTECLPESIPRLEQTLISDHAIWAVGGRLVGPTGKPQFDFNVRSFPTIGSVASEMFFLDEIWPSNPWSHSVHPDDGGQPVDVDQPAAACLMVSRAALESIGGFDEAFYPAWFEDVDLCRRIRNQGGRIQFQPNACFLHHGGYSLRTHFPAGFSGIISYKSNTILPEASRSPGCLARATTYSVGVVPAGRAFHDSFAGDRNARAAASKIVLECSPPYF